MSRSAPRMLAAGSASAGPGPRTLAVCADDYGVAPGISAGIDALARAGRLSAVACLVNGPHWPAAARAVAGWPATVDVGLHLNLTEGTPASARLARRWPVFPGLTRWLLRAPLRLLPLGLIRHEAHAQLAAFRAALGRPPAFIDGHQHVHHLPGIRDLVLDLVHHLQPMPAVRSTGRLLGPGFDFKRRVIQATGGRALASALAAQHVPHNPALLGAYDFVDPDYRGRMQAWLAEVPAEGALLFCHPGQRRPGDPPDAIAAAREREYAYLASPAFEADLAAAEVRLGRVWRTGEA